MSRWFSPKVQFVFALAILASCCWIMLFNRLDAAPMRIWDEIRLANNAIEMIETGDLIVTYHGGQPEFWNTKPPLMIWLEALSVKLLGIQTLAFRLPSAFTALATVLVLFLFTRKQLGDLWSAVLAVILLLSTEGYVLVHCARNGEYDSMLVLWILTSSIAFFRFVQHPEDRKWLWLTALFIVLGVYTKGVNALLHLPGLLLYAAAVGKFKAVFSQWKVYAAAAVALLIIGTYYIGREQLQPGYLAAVWKNELFGRYAEVTEGHRGGFFFYFVLMKSWTVILLCALPTLLIMKGVDRKVGVFAIILVGSYLLVISLSKSKLTWYEAPVYPFLALFFVAALRALVSWLQPKVAWSKYVVVLLASGVGLFWFSSTVAEVDRDVRAYHREEEYGGQLAKFFSTFPETQQVVFGMDEYDAPALYYHKYYASRSKDMELRWAHELNLAPGDIILTSVDEIKLILQEAYQTESIFLFRGMEGYVIRNSQLAPPE